MSVTFDRQLVSQDTICLNLYKRVFPKWNYELFARPNSIVPLEYVDAAAAEQAAQASGASADAMQWLLGSFFLFLFLFLSLSLLDFIKP